jgi:hypothetical protein
MHPVDHEVMNQKDINERHSGSIEIAVDAGSIGSEIWSPTQRLCTF